MVKRWAATTSDSFRFTAKFPKVITHDKRLENVDRELGLFFQAMEPLHEKTLALLIQLPPSMTIKEGIGKLEKLVPSLDERFRYAVEVRHKSWFQDLAYNFFRNERICMVWSQLGDMQTPPIVTTDFLYIRFIGDRTIDPKDFGRIQKDRGAEMRYWANEVKEAWEDQERDLKFLIASAISSNWLGNFGTLILSSIKSQSIIPSILASVNSLDSLAYSLCWFGII